jgi:hypothetical protein
MSFIPYTTDSNYFSKYRRLSILAQIYKVKIFHLSKFLTFHYLQLYLNTYYFTKFAYKFGYLSLVLCFGKIIFDFRFFTHDARMLELEIGTINSDFRI